MIGTLVLGELETHQCRYLSIDPRVVMTFPKGGVWKISLSEIRND